MYDHKVHIAIVQRSIDHWHIIDAAIADSIEEAYEYLQSNTYKTILGVAFSEVMMHELQLADNLKDHEIMSFLQHRTHDFFGASAKELNYDYQKIIDPHKSGKITLQVIAARRKMIQQLTTVCESHFFSLKAIEVSIFAIQRVLTHIDGLQSNQINAMVILRKKELVLTVFYQQKPVFIKTEVYSNLAEFMPALQRALQFYKTKHPDQTLKRLFIAGLYQQLEEFANTITQDCQLETGVARLNTACYSPQLNAAELPQLLSCCGLALRP